MRTSANHSRTHRVLWRRVACGVVAALAVAACSDDDDEGTTGSTDTPADTAASGDTEVPDDDGASGDPDTTDGTESSEGSGGTDWCAPVGDLEEKTLNDRCVEQSASGGSQSFELESGELAERGIWTWTVTDDECDDILITAVRDQLLVTVDPDTSVEETVDRVVDRLELDTAEDEEREDTEDTEAPDDTGEAVFQVIELAAGTDIEEVLRVLPGLQGAGWSVDLNYLEPLAPNNGFRPGDDPQPYAGEVPATAPTALDPPSEPSVLVLDSTADNVDVQNVEGDTVELFDLDDNGKWDEDHGHGAFVHSIIDRLAPHAGVHLEPVESTTGELPSERWAPMLFSNSDLLAAMQAATAADESYEFVNLSLGGAGCAETGLGHGVGERLALARGMRSLFGDSTVFVAAAGNSGGNIKHFPAAWVDPDAIRSFAEAVANGPGSEDENTAAAEEILDLQDHFRQDGRMQAVGSVESNGARSSFSNCGDWVNATAFGTDQIGYYPSPDNASGWATWSGTSFATANVTAQLANQAANTGVSVDGVTIGADGLAC